MNDRIYFYNNFYDSLAKIDAKYNTFEKISNIIDMLPQGARLLDIGCGYGNVSMDLIKMGIKVYGIEVNSQAISVLKKKGFHVIKHDIQKILPFRNDYFDSVLLLDILEHVFDPLSLLKESVRITKKGGSIILSIPLYFDLLDRLRILLTGSIISYDNLCYGKKLYHQFRSFNYDHIRFFNVQDVDEIIEKCGLKSEIIHYTPLTGAYYSVLVKALIACISNQYTVKIFPKLLAHSIIIRTRKI